jgi:hypothetical protein
MLVKVFGDIAAARLLDARAAIREFCGCLGKFEKQLIVIGCCIRLRE